MGRHRRRRGQAGGCGKLPGKGGCSRCLWLWPCWRKLHSPRPFLHLVQAFPAPLLLSGHTQSSPDFPALSSPLQECLLYALLKSESLSSAAGSSGPGEAAAPASPPGSPRGPGSLPREVQRYCMEILEAVLPQTVLPAATSGSSEAAVAGLAAEVLAGAVARLAGSAAGAPESAKLQLLLKLVGSYLAFACQQALEQAAPGADPRTQEQVRRGRWWVVESLSEA